MPTPYADMTEEQKQHRREYKRNWEANRTEEQKENCRWGIE